MPHNLQIFIVFLINLIFIKAAKEHPNILFIIIDDLRPALGCYDDAIAHTPNIDKLAESSFVFTNAYAQQALCAPSRNSLLTSRRPDSLHLYDFYNYWRNFTGNFTTLPQYLKEQMYKTYSIGKVFHMGMSSNYRDDFPYSWSVPTYHSSSEKYMNKPLCTMDSHGQFKDSNLICPIVIENQPLKTLPDIDATNRAIHMLNSLNVRLQDQPWFLSIGYHKPHIPFRFPYQYLEYHQNIDNFMEPNFHYRPYNVPTVSFNPYTDLRKRDDVKLFNVSFPFGPIPKEFSCRIRQAYYASVTYIDDLIGSILKHTNYSNTLVILLGDHGWSLGEHAEWAKYSNYEVATRVPLLIRLPDNHELVKSSNDLPRQQQQYHVTNIIELLDIFPTLVDLVNLPKIHKCTKKNEILCTNGKSLKDLMIHWTNNNTTNDNNEFNYVAFSQYPRPGTYPTWIPNSDEPRLNAIKIMGYSMRTNQFRYTLWIKFNNTDFTRDWNTTYGEELYDHTFDKDEMINLFDRPQLNDIKLELRKILIYKFP